MTVGGEEHFLRALADGAAQAGAKVTYLTRVQWDGPPPDTPGITLVGVSPGGPLYDEDGSRRIGPALTYGAGLLGHLVRNRSDYDLVVVGSFPYFSVLAARAGLAGSATKVSVRWIEAWTTDYFVAYAGWLRGRLGAVLQRLALRLTPAATASPFVGRRLRELRYRGPLTIFPGLLPEVREGAVEVEVPRTRLVFAGRHLDDKGVDLLPGILAGVHQRHPDLELVVAGDGPRRPWLRAALADAGLAAVVDLPGFVSDADLAELLSSAAVVLLPSRREGYGILAATAPSYGAPVVLGHFPENAAADLVVEGTNGALADPPSIEGFCDAVDRVLEGGVALRRAALRWSRQEAAGATMARSVDVLLADVAAQLGR